MKRIQSGDGATDLGSIYLSTPSTSTPCVKIYCGDDLLYDSTQSEQTWQHFLVGRTERGLRIELAGTTGDTPSEDH